MNGTAHFDKADGILVDLDRNHYDELDDRSEYQLRLAAVHAQLAVAGALAALIAEARRLTAITAGIARVATFDVLDLERRPQ